MRFLKTLALTLTAATTWLAAGVMAQPADPAPAKPADAKAEAASSKPLTGRPARIAVLNFGPPADWPKGKAGDMVGVQCNAKSWADALEELKKENATNPIDVVAVRINSGGGALSEVGKFHAVFENYKKNFRTVMWIESAISAAIMSPWVIPEIYVMPHGNFGGATAWYGAGQAMGGLALEQMHAMGEEASRLGGRDPAIMRSMQVEDALSCDIDDQGNVTWYPNMSGKVKVKPEGQVLTLTADESIRLHVAKAKAATVDELMKAMGYSEWELAGQKATKIVDESMIEITRAESQMNAVYNKYMICVQAAQSLPREQRGAEVGRARGFLKQMKDWKKKSANIGPPMEWFEQQERVLRDLLK